ncbi:MAG TPA: hypothetical protein VEX66_03645 [Microlunatus sp.]|nr:hypothetical protein [Microlunatus sp.]
MTRTESTDQGHRERPADERAGSIALSTGELWLAPDQAERLSVSFDNALLDEHETGWRNEPGPGRVRMAFVWSLLPDPLPGDVQPAPVDPAPLPDAAPAEPRPD